MITSSLKESNKFYVSPIQNGRMTTIDEYRFVIDLLEHPKETLDRFDIVLHQSRFVIQCLTKYAYTELKLTNMKDNQHWVNATMRELAKDIYGDDVFSSNSNVVPYSEAWFNFEFSFEKKEDENKKWIKHSFEPNGYVNKVIFGEYGLYGRKYGSMFQRKQDKTFNRYELAIEMRPLRLDNDIVLYKHEIDALLATFDNFHELLVAYALVVRAKFFEMSRVWYEENGHQALLESKHWWTPCVRDKQERLFCKELGFAPSHIGVVKKSMHDLLEQVLNKMEEEYLITYNSTRYCNLEKFKAYDTGYSRHYDYIQKKWDFEANGFTYEHDATQMLKQRQGHAYRPIFLTLDSDTEVAFSISYEEYTHGYVFNFIQYLCEIKHPCIEGMKCRVFTCKGCGKRVCELIEVGSETRGRKSSLCEECGSVNGRKARSRSKKSVKDVTNKN